MFRNFTLMLMLYFIVSVAVILGLFFTLVIHFHYTNYAVILLVLSLLTLALAFILSKLSIEPLKEYIDALTALSKETLHELNIPVATIKMNTQLLEKNIEDSKALKRLERIKDATLMLEMRYKELDYLIKKQALVDVIEAFELDRLIQERVENLSQLFSHVEFSLNLENFRVKVDKIGLTKVLDNILENAIKYSKKPVNVEITLKDSMLSIQDSGIGMDEVTLLKLFDGYYQEDVEKEGYGIGLSVVKRYCDSNKISLHVTSKIDVGTRINLNFKGKEIGNS